jgi:two-component system, chemotaxis family, chemotaxis protein CheY
MRAMARDDGMMESLRVLVIDDDADILGVVKAILRELGIAHVRTATGAAQMCEFFVSGARPFDLVICDWSMPEMDGLAFLGHVRRVDRETPFVMLTSRATPDAILAAKQAGVTAYVAKPFQARELQQKIRTVVRRNVFGIPGI